MKMVDENNEKWEKFANYFSGNSTEEERLAIEKWLKETSEAEKQQYYDAEQIWGFTSGAQEEFLPDAEKGWQRFQLKAKLREKPKTSFPWLKVAAAVSLLLIATYLMFNINAKPEMIEVASANDVEHVSLPDGSEIWLNRNTKISYAEDFNVDSRVVFLDGEAFFEVKKAEGKRFTVFTAETKTEVIGTSFNISARNNEPAKIQVATGKVAFAMKEDEKSIFLEPGEEATLRKDTIISQQIVDQNFRAWQNQRLIFSNTSLKELVAKLEAHFDSNIFIASEELYNCRFTVTFNQQELEKILKVISLTGNLEVTKTEQGHNISGEGCK